MKGVKSYELRVSPYFFTVFLFLVIISSLNAQTRAICKTQKVAFYESFDQCDYNPWVLVFEDNFDGNTLDLTKWEPWTGVPRDYSFQWQKAWHLPENIEVNNGILKIITKKLTTPYVGTWVIGWSTNPPTTKTSTFDYTTGEIWTHQKFTYGKYEAKIKIPKGRGFFPAFWLFGNGPDYNEIDIFEFWTQDGSVANQSKVHHMTSHYDYKHLLWNDPEAKVPYCHTEYSGIDFSQDFHIFTLIWEKNEIEWYVDGVLKRRDCRYYNTLGQEIGCDIKSNTVYLRNEIYPKDPMAIILNLAIESGIKYPGSEPDHSTPFPSQMEVDWVRYYKKCDCIDNKIITHSSQCPLDDEVYNVLVGKNVEINCSYNIPQDKQLNIIAKNGIILKPGFIANAESMFSAKIDQSICDNTSITMVENPEEIIINEGDTTIYGELFSKEISSINMKEETFSVKIYPNPNDGNFIIEFDGFFDYGKYALKIMTAQGQIVYSMDEMLQIVTPINLKEYHKGIYILSLYHKETFEKKFYKIAVF